MQLQSLMLRRLRNLLTGTVVVEIFFEIQGPIREAFVLLFTPKEKWLVIEEKKMAQALVICHFTYINYLYKHETRADYQTSEHKNWTHERVAYLKKEVCNPS